MNKTITQQLNIKEFPFIIKDSNGNEIYFENSQGYWIKREFDSNRNEIYCEDSYGNWYKQEYDSNGYRIYFEDSTGLIADYRPKKIEITLSEIADKFGISLNELKIKE